MTRELGPRPNEFLRRPRPSLLGVEVACLGSEGGLSGEPAKAAVVEPTTSLAGINCSEKRPCLSAARLVVSFDEKFGERQFGQPGRGVQGGVLREQRSVVLLGFVVMPTAFGEIAEVLPC